MAANPMEIGSEVGGAAGDLIGGLIGEAMARGDYEEADRLRKLAAQQFDGINMPGEQATLGPSDYENVTADPQAREARRAILARLQQVGFEGGMDIESRAALNQASQAAAAQEAAQRGAILDASQRRGMLSSGGNIAAQLSAQQAGANRVSMAGTQAAADARRRALQTLQASGQMAAGLDADTYNQRANLADRRDAISEFNARNAQDFAQQRYDNQMGLADKKYGAYRDSADDSQEQGDSKVRKGRGYGRTGGSIAGGIAGGAAML